VKKILAIILGLIFIFSVVSVNGAAARQRVKIVCVGDSITRGYIQIIWWFADYSHNWPSQLNTRLGANWTVVNQGVNGATTAQMLSRMSSATKLKPQYIIILGGTNDLLQNVSIKKTDANIQTMCSLTISSGAKPVLCTITPLSSRATQVNALNTWIKSYAQSKGYALIDFNAATNSPTLVSSDGTHPNAAGYTAMANAINLTIFER
jgi:acyl-CoA thioesterase-1